jgi:hypothetical protein
MPMTFTKTRLTYRSMLFEFHQKQNAKKPNSIHATYLVTGTKRSAEHTNGKNGKHGEDVDMRSSPFMSSMPEPEEPAEEPVKETTVLLVREEELQSGYYSACSMAPLTFVQRLVQASKRRPPSTSTVLSLGQLRYEVTAMLEPTRQLRTIGLERACSVQS